MPLSHLDVWAAIDALAARYNLSPSGLAKMAGLDPTSFNRSKRNSSDASSRPRWPSTESLAKLLEATGLKFSDFALMAEGMTPQRGVPLIGFAQAGNDGYFDDQGYPVGHGWDQIEFPTLNSNDLKDMYALEITGESMAPVYREGDRIIIDPHRQSFRRGDRVVVKTSEGEVLAKELKRITAEKVELHSLNPEFEDRSIDRQNIVWIARIVWASQ